MTVLDGTVTSAFARRQGVQSTSSGEAEFYGTTAVVMDGRSAKHFLEWLGYAVVLYQLCLDSSTAKAMVQHDGVGKVRHLDTRALWIQAELRNHGLTTRKVPGEKNLADLGTKAHPAKRFLELRAMMGIWTASRWTIRRRSRCAVWRRRPARRVTSAGRCRRAAARRGLSGSSC